MLGEIFKRSPAVEERAQSTMWGSWDTGLSSWAGEKVDAGSAMQLLTVYGCVRLITDSIATLPIDTFRRGADDTKVEIPKPSWLESPTVDLDFTSWCTQILSSLLLHGNAYFIVVRFPDARGISELIPLDPTVVTVRRESGRKAY